MDLVSGGHPEEPRPHRRLEPGPARSDFLSRAAGPQCQVEIAVSAGDAGDRAELAPPLVQLVARHRVAGDPSLARGAGRDRGHDGAGPSARSIWAPSWRKRSSMRS